MSNLIPTPRPDKNGKIVIRHMKTESSDHGPVSTLPAPMPVSTPSARDTSLDSLRYDLADAIFEVTVDYSEYEDAGDVEVDPKEGIYAKLLTLSSMLLIDLDEIQQDDPERFRSLAKLVERGENEAFIDNYVAFGDLEDADSDGMDVALVRSLNHYQQLEQYGYNVRRAPEEVQESMRALLEVTMQIRELVEEGDIETDSLDLLDHFYDFQRTPVIRDSKLMEYVMNNPEKSTDIAAVIKARNSVDLEAIKTVMEHPERALSEGVL